MKSKLILIVLLIYAIISYAQTSNVNNKSYGYSLDCENNQLDVLIELRDNASKIFLPNFKTLITQDGEYGSIEVNICVKDFRVYKIDEVYELDINFPNLQTTLEPVKIPPPPPDQLRNSLISIDQKGPQNIACNYELGRTLPWDAYGEEFHCSYDCDAYFPPGDHKMSFYLKLGNNVISKQENIPFKVYDTRWGSDKDYKSDVLGIYINALNDKVLVNCAFKEELDNNISDKLNYRMHLYVSNDNNFSTNDLLRGNIISNKDDEFWFELTKYQYDWYLNHDMYLISVIDPLNDYEEICENNNWYAYKVTKSYEQLNEIQPDFSILDARVYKDQHRKVTLSCVIANSRYTGITGPSELKVGVYYKNNAGEEILINTLDAGSLEPYEKRVLSFQMDENYYGALYSGRELIFKVDPENQYQENEYNEKDNIRKIITTNVSFDASEKVFIEQDFSNRIINFSFYASIPNQIVLIYVYNSSGEYVKSLSFNLENDTPGKYEFTKQFWRLGLEDGLYHYSAQFGKYDPLDSWQNLYKQTFNQYNGSFYQGEAPDLQIYDVRFERTPDNSWVYIKATIANNGNIASAKTKLDFYRENYPRQFIKTRYVSPLDPGERTTVTLQVSWQYYNIALYLNEIILILDPDNKIDEMDENNNEKKVEVPSFHQDQTYVTVSPNPFSDKVNFSFSVNFRNTDAKLSIYNQQGFLEYYTQKFYPQPGDQKISVLSSELKNSGVYHYSFLIGWNNHYFTFTGTIIKQ